MLQAAPMTPERQPLRALEKANAVRLARADLKRRIALGELTVADVIESRPAAADRWPIGDLLMSQRRWGASRCRKFLDSNQIAETRPVGKLTDRQRRVLAEALRRAERPARATTQVRGTTGVLGASSTNGASRTNRVSRTNGVNGASAPNGTERVSDSASASERVFEAHRSVAAGSRQAAAVPTSGGPPAAMAPA